MNHSSPLLFAQVILTKIDRHEEWAKKSKWAAREYVEKHTGSCLQDVLCVSSKKGTNIAALRISILERLRLL